MTVAVMNLALAVHLVSLTVLAGGAVGAFVIHGALASTVQRSSSEAGVLAKSMMRYSLTAQLGSLLMLLSGLGLLAARQWADWGHPWLSIKLAIFVVLALNGPLVGRRAGTALGAALANGEPTSAVGLLRRFTVFHVVQLTGLVVIIVLAVFRPGG